MSLFSPRLIPQLLLHWSITRKPSAKRASAVTARAGPETVRSITRKIDATPAALEPGGLLRARSDVVELRDERLAEDRLLARPQPGDGLVGDRHRSTRFAACEAARPRERRRPCFDCRQRASEERCLPLSLRLQSVRGDDAEPIYELDQRSL